MIVHVSPKHVSESGAPPGTMFERRDEDADLLCEVLLLGEDVLLAEGVTEAATGATSIASIAEGVAVELKESAAKE